MLTKFSQKMQVAKASFHAYGQPRRIGDLLNTIRLNGESQELVDAVVDLSIRYGIITPYTSFLIEEDDVLSQLGRERAEDSFADEAQNLATTSTGASAVDAADTSIALADAEAPAEPNDDAWWRRGQPRWNDDGNRRRSYDGYGWKPTTALKEMSIAVLSLIRSRPLVKRPLFCKATSGRTQHLSPIRWKPNKSHS